jgi:hypothetical protein
MASRPYQIGSPSCGCPDCIADYPPARYGPRPERDGCLGKWQVRYRGEGRRQHLKNFDSLADANRFLASLPSEGVRCGA